MLCPVLRKPRCCESPGVGSMVNPTVARTGRRMAPAPLQSGGVCAEGADRGRPAGGDRRDAAGLATSAAGPRPGVFTTWTGTRYVSPGDYFFGGLFPLPLPDLLPVVEGAFAGLPPPLFPFSIFCSLVVVGSFRKPAVHRQESRTPVLGCNVDRYKGNTCRICGSR